MNKCPQCGTEYEGAFCPNGCNAPKICPKCGTQYTGNFCPKGCNSPYKTKKGLKAWQIVLIVIGILLVITIIVGNALSSGKTSNDTTIENTSTTQTLSEVDSLKQKIEDNISSSFKGNTYKIELSKQQNSKYNAKITLDFDDDISDYRCGAILFELITGVNETDLVNKYDFVINSDSKLVYTSTFDNSSKDNSLALKTADGQLLKARTQEQYYNELDEANKKEEEQSRKAYENSFESISYNELARNPDKYKGKLIKIKIEINQIMSGGWFTDGGYRGYEDYEMDFEDSNATFLKKEWYVSYKLPEGESKILEDDVIEFYGEYLGTQTVERALTNTKDEVPCIKAEYHKIVKAAE